MQRMASFSNESVLSRPAKSKPMASADSNDAMFSTLASDAKASCNAKERCCRKKKNIKIHLLVQKHHGDRCRQTQAFSLGFHKICKNSTFSKLVGVAIAMRLTLHFGVSQLLCHVCNGNVPRCGQIHRQLHLCRFHVMMFNFFVSIILYTSINGINLIPSSIKQK